jgi:hypothetical protein
MKCIFQISELVSQPKHVEAKALLDRLAAATEGIMNSRGWKVKHLKEFYPDDPSLLGLNENKGNAIKIRLRDPKNKNLFLAWESLLGTMIHELTHNEISDHSAKFYNLVDTIYDEVTSSSTGGYSQKFFGGKSCKLGGESLRVANLKVLTANAALQRQFNSGYCHVLGGQTSTASLKVSIASSAQKRCSDSLVYDSNLSSISNMLENETINSDIWICPQCLDQNKSIIQSCKFCGYFRISKSFKRRNVVCLECSDRNYCNFCSAENNTKRRDYDFT